MGRGSLKNQQMSDLVGEPGEIKPSYAGGNMAAILVLQKWETTEGLLWSAMVRTISLLVRIHIHTTIN